MQFFYHENAGMQTIEFNNKDSHYIFHVRRFKQCDVLKVRNLNDENLYYYRHIKKNIFTLECIETAKTIEIKYVCNIILSMIDTKDIYEILPFLNALYVTNLYLFYADFSQKNRKIDLQKAQRIIMYSCMQSGRTSAMNIQVFKNLESILQNNTKACYIDFCKDNLSATNQELFFEKLSHEKQKLCGTNGVIIGPEGGFSQRETNILRETQQQYALNMPHILTAHLASVYISSICFSAYSN